ncbi:MAG: archease [Planctomycetota bacterium]
MPPSRHCNGKFAVLDHTADTGLCLTGTTHAALLQAAADGFVAIVFGRRRLKRGTPRTVELREGSFEELLVELLRTLHLMLDVDRRRVDRVEVEQADELSCRAVIYSEPLADAGEVHTLLKAITYHDLRLTGNEGDYTITVVLDV